MEFMSREGLIQYNVIGDVPQYERLHLKGEKFYYAVANGDETGIHECY